MGKGLNVKGKSAKLFGKPKPGGCGKVSHLCEGPPCIWGNDFIGQFRGSFGDYMKLSRSFRYSSFAGGQELRLPFFERITYWYPAAVPK